MQFLEEHESAPAWRSQRVRGGGPSTDFERVIMFTVVLVFCGALVTGIVGSTLYIVQTNANVRC